MRIEHARDRFLRQRRADGCSEHTLGQLRRHVTLLVSWADGLAVERLTHGHVAAFLTSDTALRRADGTQRSTGTLNALRSSVRSFGAYLHAAGYADRNPAALVRRARVGPRAPRPVSADAVDLVLAVTRADDSAAGRRDHVLFAVLHGTGSRISALLAAEVADVDLHAGTLHLRTTKGGGSQVVELPPTVRLLLRGHLDGIGPGPLFRSRGGGRLGRRQAAARLRGWCVRVGITPTLASHDLRRAYASRRYAADRDILGTKCALGHASLASTARYIGQVQSRAPV